MAIFERISKFIDKKENGCWNWTGDKAHGYGVANKKRFKTLFKQRAIKNL